MGAEQKAKKGVWNTILPEGTFIVVYLSKDRYSDGGHGGSYAFSEAWPVKSLNEGYTKIREFCANEEFIPDSDGQFEIFDDCLQGVGDQNVIEPITQDAFDRQERELEGEDLDMDAARESLREEWQDDDIPHPYPESNVVETKPSPEERNVSFPEIKIEDNRKEKTS